MRVQRLFIHAVLCALCVLCGCITLKGVEKRPTLTAGQDAAVSEETTLGMKSASNNKVQGNKAEIGDRNVGTKNQGNVTTTQRGERIVNTGGQWPVVAMGLGAAAILGIFAWAVTAQQRMTAYRDGLLIVQWAIKDAAAEDVVARVKPCVRAMGRRKKELFDRLLMEA